MQKKADGHKIKKRPVGRPCKKRSPSEVLTNRTVKSTVLMTESDDRDMMLRWRDEEGGVDRTEDGWRFRRCPPSR